MKKRTALIEIGKDGTFGVFSPDIKSVIFGEGNTVAEAKADFENSVREIIQFCQEDGVQDPDDLKNVAFAIFFELLQVPQCDAVCQICRYKSLPDAAV